jgi:hypothetical protein
LKYFKIILVFFLLTANSISAVKYALPIAEDKQIEVIQLAKTQIGIK